MSDESDKLFFNKADRYFNAIATDIAISGPTPDGFQHISFIRDTIEVVSQTKTNIVTDTDSTQFELNYRADDAVIGRELVGVCSLTDKAYKSLLTALIDRMIASGGKDDLVQILKEKKYFDYIEDSGQNNAK